MSVPQVSRHAGDAAAHARRCTTRHCTALHFTSCYCFALLLLCLLLSSSLSLSLLLSLSPTLALSISFSFSMCVVLLSVPQQMNITSHHFLCLHVCCTPLSATADEHHFSSLSVPHIRYYKYLILALQMRVASINSACEVLPPHPLEAMQRNHCSGDSDLHRTNMPHCF